MPVLKRGESEDRGKGYLRGTYVPISGGRKGRGQELGYRGWVAGPRAVTAAFSALCTPPFLTEPLKLGSDIIEVGKSLRPTTESPDRSQARQGALDPVHRPKSQL